MQEFEGLTSEDEGNACPSAAPRPAEGLLLPLEIPATTPPLPFTSSPLLDLSGEDMDRLFRGTELPCAQPPQELSSPHVVAAAATSSAAAKTAATASAPELAEGVRTRRTASSQRSGEHRTPARLRRPTRHISTPNKLKDWSLTITRKWVILGDSNFARFLTFEAEDLQVDAFPGAK